ncbi:hypothetical protein QFZ20_005046 [Flavobacterium sp. W4I14]|nr:hypothetical protein [Flavobacterium sp. W4I14]
MVKHKASGKIYIIQLKDIFIFATKLNKQIMKKILLTLAILCCFTVLTKAQFEGSKQIFESPKLKETIKTQKTVAILPFEVKISYRKQPKNFNAEANKSQEESMARSIQASMYTFLLRKASDYTVTFQDVDKTNILLKKAGVLGKLDETTKDELAKILGVDAVIGGRFETEQTKSEAGAIASAVLFGGFGGKSGTGTMFLTINNGADGELMWRFFKTMDDSIMSSTDDMVERMMRKISRNFPYKS